MEKSNQSTTTFRETRLNILIMAFVLLLAIMSFTGFVNYMTFAQNYNNSLANTYSVAGNEIARKIEYALHYGKPINNFYGMHETLQELKEVIDEVEQVNIVSTQGEVLYDLNGFVKDTKLPDGLMKTAMFRQGTVSDGKLSYQVYKEAAYVFIPINDSHNQLVASLVMVFPSDGFTQITSPFILRLIACLIWIALAVIILLAFILFKTQIIFHGQSIYNKKRLLIVFIILLGSSQLIYGGINYVLFKNAYKEMAAVSQTYIQKIVAKNMDSIYAKGLSLQDVTGVDDYLDAIQKSMPQIQELRLIPAEKNGQALTKVHVTVSNTYIKQQMFKTLLNMLTVLVISILFMIELTLLAITLMNRGPTKRMSDSAAPDTGHGMVRGLTYLVNVGAYMSLTFIPLAMKDYYEPLFGLPQDVVLGLPLSAEMLGGVLAILAAGRVMTRQGWRTALYWGAALLAIGNLWSGFCVSALPFIFSRGIAGLGLGYILMAIRSLVVSLPQNNLAIAEYSAGSVAGLNCGLVMGGMLADRIGYAAVFYIAAVMVIIPTLFVHRFMDGFDIAPREPNDRLRIEKLTKLVADKKSLLFLMCILVPYFISCAFLDYYFPLFLSSHAFSQSDISRGFLLNGLVVIYMGPVLTRYIANRLKPVQGLIMAMVFVIGAFVNFTLFATVGAAFATIIILGIAESFGVPLITTYFLQLKGIRDLTINKGIAMFSIMVNGSRMAGPIVFGIAVTLGMRMGVGLISLLMLILSLVFIYSIRFDPAREKFSESA